MCLNRSLFFSLDTSLVHPPVIVANGFSSPVSSTRMVHSSTIPLEFVLFVPNFPVNLLSISKITKDFNCCVTFFFYSLCFSGSPYDEEFFYSLCVSGSPYDEEDWCMRLVECTT